MHPPNGTPPSVLLRDLFLFHVKLALDGIKDVVLIWLSVMAVIGDFILGAPRRGQLFYSVMRLGERFDLWLNVYAASRGAGRNPEGLFGESSAADETYMGRMERLIGSEGRQR